MDLSNVSIEELNKEIERRKISNVLISHTIKFKELTGLNNYDLFVTTENYRRMIMSDKKEIEEDAITLYDMGVESVSDLVDMKKLYFYESFKDLLIDILSIEEILCDITSEQKIIDFSDVKRWSDLGYITVRLNNGKEVYLHYIGGE